MERLFVDTSAWFSYANRKDPDRDAVRRALRASAARITTSNFVFDEIVSLCRYRLGHPAAAGVGAVLLDADTVDLIRVTPDDERAAWSVFRERSDQSYSFTDCTSFVLMRRLRIGTAVALDDDFRIEGFQVVP